METVEYKNISFTVWDVGGQDKVKTLLLAFVHSYYYIPYVHCVLQLCSPQIYLICLCFYIMKALWFCVIFVLEASG